MRLGILPYLPLSIREADKLVLLTPISAPFGQSPSPIGTADTSPRQEKIAVQGSERNAKMGWQGQPGMVL